MPEFAYIFSLAKPFSIVLVRASGVVGCAPVLGGKQVPLRIRAALALLVSAVLFPAIRAQIPDQSLGMGLDFVLVAKELAVGLTLGFVAHVSFLAAQVAGEFIGLQMGFSVATVADPLSGDGQMSVTSQYYTIFCTIVFVLIDGHHWFLLALARSYDAVPVMGFSLSPGLGRTLFRCVALFYLLGVQMAMPLVACLVLVTVAMGVVAKTVPQINIIQMGFALRIGVGVACMVALLPVFHSHLRHVFLVLQHELFRVLSLM